MSLAEAEVPLSQPNQRYHAFISHSHTDKTIAEKIIDRLTKEGMDVYDYDSGADFGGIIFKNIMKAINSSGKVVLLVSKEFMTSEYFAFEYMHSIWKEYHTKKLTLIPVLLDVKPEDLPSLVAQRKALTFTDDEEFFHRLIHTVRVEAPMDESLPAGDVGTGLAWSFFYGYLKLKLPSFSKQLDEACSTKEYKDLTHVKRFNKLVILLPSSCLCPDKFNEFQGISYLTKVEYYATRGGIMSRSYNSIMYTVTDVNLPDEMVFAGAVEYATPILSMFDMLKSGQLTPDELLHQRQVFYIKLQEILMHDPECRDKVLLVAFNDTEEHRDKESSVLASFIHQRMMIDEAGDKFCGLRLGEDRPEEMNTK